MQIKTFNSIYKRNSNKWSCNIIKYMIKYHQNNSSIFDYSWFSFTQFNKQINLLFCKLFAKKVINNFVLFFIFTLTNILLICFSTSFTCFISFIIVSYSYRYIVILETIRFKLQIYSSIMLVGMVFID